MSKSKNVPGYDELKSGAHKLSGLGDGLQPFVSGANSKGGTVTPDGKHYGSPMDASPVTGAADSR